MKLKASSGVTLTELMVATAILTIGVIASMGAFKYIAQSITYSRTRTLVTNLAQEKMEVLKNKPYYQLLVTTDTANTTGFSTNFAYDIGNYPPETFAQWGVSLTRVVKIDYASVSGGTVVTVPYTSDDTGTKKITVYVYWTDRNTAQKIQLDSYYQNPSVAVLSTGFSGQVCTAPNTPTCSAANSLPGALVQVIGTPKWKGYADSSGNYSFQVSPGSYTLVASTPGYTSQATGMISALSGVYTVSSFTLTVIASGTVSATSLYTRNTNLVISQVVATTTTVVGDGSSKDVEYVELFNPTTFPINISPVGGPPIVTFSYLGEIAADNQDPVTSLVYVSTYVAPGRYYLFANATSFHVLGGPVTADAYYSPLYADIIKAGKAGAIVAKTGLTISDAVGWKNGAIAAPSSEGGAVPLLSGLLATDQIVRFSTACAVGATYGRAYDTDNNSNNFYYNGSAFAVGLLYRPFNSSYGAQTVLSGRPSTGAYVYANDGNSGAVTSSNGSVSGPQGQTCTYSSFTLVGVATGTWKVTAVASGFNQVVSNVIVTQAANTAIANAVTSPVWPLASMNYVALTSTYTGGVALGFVYGAATAYTTRLNAISLMASSGGAATSDSQGFYVLYLPTGTATITANSPSNGTHQASAATVTITQGAVTIVPDFHLAQGATIKGYVTSGTGALPGIAVRAASGADTFQDTSDETGYFYIFVSTASTAWTITADLDPLQSYTSLAASPCTGSPITCTASVPGSTIFAGTITVSGSLGTITGSVTDGGSAITTGVLIVASTGTIPDPLPAVYASSSAATAIFYSASSQSNGTYSVEVRNDATNTYNMRAFYPTVNINTGAVSYKTATKSAVTVTAGSVTPAQNFTTWP